MSYDTKDLVTRYRSSGLTQKQFCSRHSVLFSTLQYHLQKSKYAPKPEKIPAAFIPLKVPQVIEAMSTVAIIRGKFPISKIAELIKSFEN